MTSFYTVTNSQLASMPAATLKANNLVINSPPGDLSYSNFLLSAIPTGTSNGNITGAIPSQVYSASYQKIGNMIYLTLPPWASTATSSGIVTFSTPLPVGFRPSSIIKRATIGNRNAQRSTSFQIDTAGVVTFYGDETGGNFNNGQASSFFGGNAIYIGV